MTGSTGNSNRSSTFSSIRAKLVFSFGSITVIIVMLVGALVWYQNTSRQITSVNNTLKELTLKVQQANDQEKDFFIEETINLNFYETKASPYIDRHKALLSEIKSSLQQLKTAPIIDRDETVAIDGVMTEIDQFEGLFDSLTAIILTRGFESYGTEGEMRRAISRVENAGFTVDPVRILEIRRREKDYILRKDELYIGMLLAHLDTLANEVGRIDNEYGRFYISSNIDQYRNNFLQLVELGKLIGYQGQTGLRNRLNNKSTTVKAQILNIDNNISAKADIARKQVTTTIVSISVLFVFLVVVLSIVVTRSLSRPVSALSNAIHTLVENNFSVAVPIPGTQRKDEIGKLATDFSFMFGKVKERTEEVLLQKQQISEAYENLIMMRKIGQQVTSTLSIDKIVETLYISSTKLFEVSAFHAGVYDKKTGELVFKGSRVDGDLLAEFRISTNGGTLAAHCFDRQVPLTNKAPAGPGNEGADGQEPFPGEPAMKSVVYLPLTSKDKKIGVISFQHHTEGYFSDYQFNIIRNLAVYAEIALDNALIYENLEELVLERTSEVRERNKEIIEQKEQIEAQKTEIELSFRNIQLLSGIGKELNSYLSVERINETMYRHVRDLMDTHAFGIGILDAASGKIVFKKAIESGRVLEDYSYSLSGSDNPAARCMKEGRELVVDDLENTAAMTGQGGTEHWHTPEGMPRSVAYIPLVSKKVTIGVMGVQSLKPHAYQAIQLEILRNLANYAAIALDNANAYQEIENQHIAIEASNKKITSSINYARRIQNALLPSLSELDSLLPDSFLFQKPKDIVSGDFFWFAKVNQHLVLAAVDCTGHGVPGAFMSTIGSMLLDETVRKNKTTSPDEILAELRKGVRRILKQQLDNNESRDGMDAAVCTLDMESRTLYFAGAYNPLVYIQNNTARLVEGDKMPIGGKQLRSEKPYTLHAIPVKKPTAFYIFSDGYQDQFGGQPDGGGKKFTKKAFLEFLGGISQKPAPAQKQLLEQQINTWMCPDGQHRHKQIDDILVFGAKLDLSAVEKPRFKAVPTASFENA